MLVSAMLLQDTVGEPGMTRSNDGPAQGLHVLHKMPSQLCVLLLQTVAHALEAAHRQGLPVQVVRCRRLQSGCWRKLTGRLCMYLKGFALCYRRLQYVPMQGLHVPGQLIITALHPISGNCG